MSKPQVIDDVEHERVWDIVAAVDVAKKEGMVCLRRPGPEGRQAKVWPVPATVNAVSVAGGW